MDKTTMQINTWTGEFGREYTDRNPQSLEEMDALYETYFGFTRSILNKEFLGDLDRSIRVLEVGANIGTQLQALQAMGFTRLYGIELQEYAVEVAKERTRGINLIQGTAFDVPFKDGYFDLVFTSGVLIHVSPDDIGDALAEIHRCSRHYIWGYEYFAEEYSSIPYRGRDDLMWKTNFAELFLDRFSDLGLVKEKRLDYLHGGNTDTMYLLEKKATFQL